MKTLDRYFGAFSIACLTVLILVFSVIHMTAHEVSPVLDANALDIALTSMAQGDSFLLLDNTSLQLFSFEERSQSKSFNVLSVLVDQSNSLAEGRQGLTDIDVDSSAIYVIRNLSTDIRSRISDYAIFRITSFSEVGQAIFQAKNIYNMNLAPSGQFAAVSRFMGEMGRSPTSICLLNITTSICRDLNLPELSHFSTWVDAHTLIVTNPDGLLLVDALTLNYEPLPGLEEWSIQKTVHIPGTDLLLVITGVDANHRLSRFLQYDLTTKQVRELNYPPTSMNYSQITDIQFSTNGLYFAYRGLGRNSTLAEFQTGKIITEFRSGQFKWVKDKLISVDLVNDSLVQVVQIDVVTGQSTLLLEADHSLGVFGP